jgi:hypothetical protein
VAVPASLAKSVKMVAKSMQLHAAHDSRTMTPHYHARLATFGAKESMEESEYKHAQSVHKSAGRAKHLVGATAIAALSGPCSSSKAGRSNGRWADVVDTTAANGGVYDVSSPGVEVDRFQVGKDDELAGAGVAVPPSQSDSSGGLQATKVEVDGFSGSPPSVEQLLEANSWLMSQLRDWELWFHSSFNGPPGCVDAVFTSELPLVLPNVIQSSREIVVESATAESDALKACKLEIEALNVRLADLTAIVQQVCLTEVPVSSCSAAQCGDLVQGATPAVPRVISEFVEEKNAKNMGVVVDQVVSQLPSLLTPVISSILPDVLRVSLSGNLAPVMEALAQLKSRVSKVEEEHVLGTLAPVGGMDKSKEVENKNVAVHIADSPIEGGSPVFLTGLVKMPALNGSMGVVTGYDLKSERYIVEVERHGTKRFKRCNLVADSDLDDVECDEGSEGEPCTSGLSGLDIDLHSSTRMSAPARR